MADTPRRMDIAEFRDLGLLQEVNRRVLHPLGLAIEVVVEEDGTSRLGGVWDYRTDPEGIIFALDGSGYGESRAAFRDRAEHVALEWKRRRLARVAALGYMVQPIEESDSATVDEPLT